VDSTRSCPFPRSRFFLRSLVVSGVLLAACSDSGSNRTLKSMEVTPTNPSLAIQSALQLHLELLGHDQGHRLQLRAGHRHCRRYGDHHRHQR